MTFIPILAVQAPRNEVDSAHSEPLKAKYTLSGYVGAADAVKNVTPRAARHGLGFRTQGCFAKGARVLHSLIRIQVPK